MPKASIALRLAPECDEDVMQMGQTLLFFEIRFDPVDVIFELLAGLFEEGVERFIEETGGNVFHWHGTLGKLFFPGYAPKGLAREYPLGCYMKIHLQETLR